MSMNVNVRTAKLDSLRLDIAKGLSDAQNGPTKEIDFASLKQQGRQLLKDRKCRTVEYHLSTTLEAAP